VVIYLTERDHVSSHQSRIPFKQCHATLLQTAAEAKPLASRSAGRYLAFNSQRASGIAFAVHRTRDARRSIAGRTDGTPVSHTTVLLLAGRRRYLYFSSIELPLLRGRKLS